MAKLVFIQRDSEVYRRWLLASPQLKMAAVASVLALADAFTGVLLPSEIHQFLKSLYIPLFLGAVSVASAAQPPRQDLTPADRAKVDAAQGRTPSGQHSTTETTVPGKRGPV
jgi:hypothetical protein